MIAEEHASVRITNFHTIEYDTSVVLLACPVKKKCIMFT